MKERNIRTGKAVSILMVLILTFMFVLMPIEVNAQTARGSLCTYCGMAELIPHTTYGAWNKYDSTPCVHGYRYGSDVKCSRKNVIIYRCPKCGEADSTQSTEYKTECQGYN